MNNPGNTGHATSLRYGTEMEMTYREIAEELGVSYQSVQQTENRAIRKFKERFQTMFPDTWHLIEGEIQGGSFGREVLPFLWET